MFGSNKSQLRIYCYCTAGQNGAFGDRLGTQKTDTVHGLLVLQTGLKGMAANLNTLASLHHPPCMGKYQQLNVMHNTICKPTLLREEDRRTGDLSSENVPFFSIQFQVSISAYNANPVPWTITEVFKGA